MSFNKHIFTFLLSTGKDNHKQTEAWLLFQSHWAKYSNQGKDTMWTTETEQK